MRTPSMDAVGNSAPIPVSCKMRASDPLQPKPGMFTAMAQTIEVRRGPGRSAPVEPKP